MQAIPTVELIFQHFPHLSDNQREQFQQLGILYAHWNQRINVISRKDIQNIYRNHILHSLGVEKVIKISPQAEVLDVGTGGGFPGIPLAIMFPQAQFLLIDSIGKKIKVVQEVAKELSLTNLRSQQVRAAEVTKNFDLILGRAVARIPNFISWIQDNLSTQGMVVLLKGGDLRDEIRSSGLIPEQHDMEALFNHHYFRDKKILVFRAADITRNFRQPSGSHR